MKLLLNICLGMLFVSTSISGYAQCTTEAKNSKKITAYISDNLGFNQSNKNITIQFENGSAVKFKLNISQSQKEQKISLPACDNYQYSITGETTFFHYVDGVFTSKKINTESGKQNIRILDGDRLIVTGEPYDFKTPDYKVFLQLDTHKPLSF